MLVQVRGALLAVAALVVMAPAIALAQHHHGPGPRPPTPPVQPPSAVQQQIIQQQMLKSAEKTLAVEPERTDRVPAETYDGLDALIGDWADIAELSESELVILMERLLGGNGKLSPQADLLLGNLRIEFRNELSKALGADIGEWDGLTRNQLDALRYNSNKAVAAAAYASDEFFASTGELYRQTVAKEFKQAYAATCMCDPAAFATALSQAETAALNTLMPVFVDGMAEAYQSAFSLNARDTYPAFTAPKEYFETRISNAFSDATLQASHFSPYTDNIERASSSVQEVRRIVGNGREDAAPQLVASIPASDGAGATAITVNDEPRSPSTNEQTAAASPDTPQDTGGPDDGPAADRSTPDRTPSEAPEALAENQVPDAGEQRNTTPTSMDAGNETAGEFVSTPPTPMPQIAPIVYDLDNLPPDCAVGNNECRWAREKIIDDLLQRKVAELNDLTDRYKDKVDTGYRETLEMKQTLTALESIPGRIENEFWNTWWMSGFIDYGGDIIGGIKTSIVIGACMTSTALCATAAAIDTASGKAEVVGVGIGEFSAEMISGSGDLLAATGKGGTALLEKQVGNAIGSRTGELAGSLLGSTAASGRLSELASEATGNFARLTKKVGEENAERLAGQIYKDKAAEAIKRGGTAVGAFAGLAAQGVDAKFGGSSKLVGVMKTVIDDTTSDDAYLRLVSRREARQ